MPLAIIVSFMFVENYLLIYHLRDTLPSPTEIFDILIAKIFEMKSLKSGLSMHLRIQIWHGLTAKQFFCALLTACSISYYCRRSKLSKAPCINSTLKKGMRCCDATKRNYRKLRNRVNNKVKTTKASYYHTSLTQSEIY